MGSDFESAVLWRLNAIIGLLLTLLVAVTLDLGLVVILFGGAVVVSGGLLLLVAWSMAGPTAQSRSQQQ